MDGVLGAAWVVEAPRCRSSPFLSGAEGAPQRSRSGRHGQCGGGAMTAIAAPATALTIAVKMLPPTANHAHQHTSRGVFLTDSVRTFRLLVANELQHAPRWHL